MVAQDEVDLLWNYSNETDVGLDSTLCKRCTRWNDGIPAKIIKCSKSIIAPQITSILNMSIDQNVFPDKLKKAQVTPLYKKNDPL